MLGTLPAAMPSDDRAVPPPRRRPLGRGGAGAASGSTPTTPPDRGTVHDPDGLATAPRAPGGADKARRAPGPATSEQRLPKPPEQAVPAAVETAHGPQRIQPRATERPEPGLAVNLTAGSSAPAGPPPVGPAVAEPVTGEPGTAPAEQEPAAAQPGGADAGSAAEGEGAPGGTPSVVVPAARATAEAAAVRETADGAEEEPGAEDGRFTVVLDNFEGPFDLLLQLISKHKMDVTEVALSRVTDEFMAHIRAKGPAWDLDQTTEFLVVAATLLDLKAARLLPAAEVEDEADLALLEARDLLFARLLQYRAYKQVADVFADRLAAESHRHPRTVGLEPHHAELLPEVILSIGPEGFAKLAVKAMQAKPKPQVYIDHIHAPLVSVREQAEIVVKWLRTLGEADFAALTEDAADTLTVVARFLALLELYRERAVTLDQQEPLGTLTVRWCGGNEDGADPVVTDEFDQESAPAQPEEGAPR